MKRRDADPTPPPQPFWQQLLLAVAQPVVSAVCNTVSEVVVRRIDAAHEAAAAARGKPSKSH